MLFKPRVSLVFVAFPYLSFDYQSSSLDFYIWCCGFIVFALVVLRQKCFQ